MNASERTNANTIGARDFIRSLKSFDPAVMPVTCASRAVDLARPSAG